MGYLSKEIIWFTRHALLFCDGNCSKAFGINSRPKIPLSDDDDDFEYMADNEVGEAPADPGSTEGDQPKPKKETEKLNKWCARECERSCILSFPDFSKRLPNKGYHD